jgi:predicted nuclease of restriction endonuclease-like (RecB) superfamily
MASKTRARAAAVNKVTTTAGGRSDESFDAIVRLIDAARQRAYQAVNTALIDLYWQIGEHISRKIAEAEWGDGVVDRLAAHIARTHPGLRGFTRPNLFRMRQFNDAYAGVGESVSALLRQIPWTHHLIILGQSRRPEEREFYVQLAAEQKGPSRQLERQFKLGLFERVVTQPPKVSAALRQTHPRAAGVFKDAYLLDFLDLPQPHTEADLHASLLTRLRQFLIELGRDFCFVGSAFPLQVGGRDFALDVPEARRWGKRRRPDRGDEPGRIDRYAASSLRCSQYGRSGSSSSAYWSPSLLAFGFSHASMCGLGRHGATVVSRSAGVAWRILARCALPARPRRCRSTLRYRTRQSSD